MISSEGRGASPLPLECTPPIDSSLGRCHPQWVFGVLSLFSVLSLYKLQHSTKIISFESLFQKACRPQKALSNIPDSARPPLGTGILRFLVLACFLS